MSTLTIEERVAAGFAFMDEQRPGWWQVGTFSLENFDLSEPCWCVVGQVCGGFNEGLVTLDLTVPAARRLGMYVSVMDSDVMDSEYGELEEEWRRLIAARRAEQVTR